MTLLNLAGRANNHNYKFDPINRSVIDTDFYKLLMAQFIWKYYPDVMVSFKMKNRTASINLADVFSMNSLHEQFEHASSVQLSKTERIWLAGNTFYGKEGMFEKEFLDWLSTYRFPKCKVTVEDGQYVVEVSGRWLDVTLAEIPILSVVNELRSRAIMSRMNELELDIMFARAKNKLWNKIELLKNLDGLLLSEFGTRRRFSFLWQEWCIQSLMMGLGSKFVGTSNALMAMRNNLESIGTNAHELPMGAAALAFDNNSLMNSQYEVLEKWQEMYSGRLLIMLPDTFGTTQFLENSPSWLTNWTGARIDSKDPIEGGEEFIDWWKEKGVDPETKQLLWSDGLNVGTGKSDDIAVIHNHFEGKVKRAYGWGTNCTNDFIDCNPNHTLEMKPVSLVCKIHTVEGKSAVKLSDNVQKATGSASEIARYIKVFGNKNKQSKILET